MTPAGTPATPPPTVSPTRLRNDSVAQPSETDPGSPLARFLAEGERRRTAHTRQSAERPADWADPDPSAIQAPPLGRNPVDAIIHRLKPGSSVDSFTGSLRRACERIQGLDDRLLTDADARLYPWHHLSPDDASDYRRAVYARYEKQSSRNDAVSAVRRVIKECCKAGLISPLRRDLIMDELYTLAPGDSTKRRRLTTDEINALLKACEDNKDPRSAARDSAIIALLFSSGMRIGELIRLEVRDWDPHEDTLLLRDTKNRRDHTVFLHPAVPAFLERWLVLRGNAPGALFTAVTRQDTRPLHRYTMRQMVQRRAADAGVRHFDCHDFRRTFATDLLRTHDPSLVGKLLNHKKLSSTMIYDLAGEDDQRAAVARIALLELGAGDRSTAASDIEADPLPGAGAA